LRVIEKKKSAKGDKGRRQAERETFKKKRVAKGGKPGTEKKLSKARGEEWHLSHACTKKAKG